MPVTPPRSAPPAAVDAPALPTRRDFAKTLAVAAATPLLAGVGACAPSAPPAAPEPAPPVTDPADPVAVALAEVIRLRYGARLTVQEMETVRKGIEGNLRAARTLRAFDLPVATEPAAVFRAYRGEAG